MADNDRMYPSLYGEQGDPGVEQSQDITDQPLPGLSEEPSQARGQGMSVVPGSGAQLEGAAAPDQIEASGAIDETQIARKRRTYQDRINQLTRQRHEAEEANSMLLNKLEQLAQQNNALQQQMNQLRTPMQQRPQQVGDFGLGDFGDGSPTAGAAGVAQQQSPAPLDVQGLVQSAIESYDARQRSRYAAVEQLHSAQRRSFGQVVKEYPEFADARSEAAEVFGQLWDASPMRNDPDGPYHVALQVRGLLADEVSAGRSPQQLEDRKRQASIVTPRPTLTDTPAVKGKAIQEKLNELWKSYKGGNSDPDTYNKIRTLQVQLRGLSTPK